jgi:transcriptional regulator with XRE-family HTH domain
VKNLTRIRRRFARNLKNIREKKELTQEQLAERLGISVRYVQKLESKNCPNVKLDTIEGLSKALKVNPIEFLEN